MKHLSGGMKQKLGLVCTLIHEPEFAILDEPTTGVDPVSRRDFWAILAELIHTRGMTALVSTAYMDEAARFHRLSFLSEGKVLAAGTPGEVQELVPGSVLSFQATPQLENPDWVNIATNDIPGYSASHSVPVTPGDRFFRAVAR